VQPKERLNQQQGKPNVLLIGTSNIKNIKADQLSGGIHTMKIVKTTLDVTMKYQGSPDVIILHSLTNDLKSMSPNECVEKMFTIVNVILPKWPV
jgi:hypothetical protein